MTNNTPSSTPPKLTSATVDGATLTLTYGEALDEDIRACGHRFHGDGRE